MNEFWINNGWYFIYAGGLIICLFFFSLHNYTGSVKKLDLIIHDIRTLGQPRKEVLQFDKFRNSQTLDPYRMSTFTHLFYFIPKRTQTEELFNNRYFLDQLSIVKLYRNIYKIVFCIILLDTIFILTMAYLFGQNIK